MATTKTPKRMTKKMSFHDSLFPKTSHSTIENCSVKERTTSLFQALTSETGKSFACARPLFAQFSSKRGPNNQMKRNPDDLKIIKQV